MVFLSRPSPITRVFHGGIFQCLTRLISTQMWAKAIGAYKIGLDEAVIPLISSANIACGFHAGDPLVMAQDRLPGGGVAAWVLALIRGCRTSWGSAEEPWI
jgi:hypothetical protein